MPNIKRSILNRIFFSFGCVVVFAGLVIWYIINIQIVDGAKWRSLSDSQTIKYNVIKAVRGNIYASDGTLLATSVPRYDIYLDFTIIPDDTFRAYIPQLARKFSEKFKDKPAVEYLLSFKEAKLKKKSYYFLKRHLSYLDIKEIKTWPLFKKGRYKSGLIIEEQNIRVMPFRNLLARTIGYATNGKDKGRVGLEGAFDKELSGITGQRLVQKIPGGYRPVNDNNEVEPVDGKDVYTTIDINFQDIVNKALQTGLLKHQAHHGCAILMEVSTGEIKAMANLTESGNGTYRETFNYAIGESFEPGSTFKLVSALALLEGDKIDLEDTVLINYGTYQINGETMIDSEESPFKSRPFWYAFEHSSNVGISTAVLKAYRDNPASYIDYIKTLKLDKPLGLELPGEGNPFIRSVSSPSWSKTSLPWMSIGYELKLTPLQLLTVYNAVANDGEMLKPLLVKAIGHKGEIEKKITASIVNDKIASKSTLKKIKKLLKGVVDSGTAKRIGSSPVDIAGKTGTARISDGRGYAIGAYYASFAGYFPADNPKYSVIVVVNRPKIEGYFGGVVAAPIVKDIAEKISGIEQTIGIELPDTLSDKGTLPLILSGKKRNATNFLEKFTNYDYSSSSNSANWIMARKDSLGEYKYNTIADNPNVIPDLQGMGLKDALYLVENKNVRVISQGKGRVYWQSLRPGYRVINRSTLIIKLKM